MKLPARNVAWLLPLLLTACVHKSEQAQVQPLAPPIVDTPPAKPAPPTDLPPPVVTPPTQTPAPDANANANVQPQEPPEPQPKHRKPPARNTQQASTSDSGVSAIGQLSTGDPADVRQQTVNSIAATERGLKDLGRKLSEQEMKTAVQIREFLKEAKDALTSGDVDGAHTLAAKAKVLLGELVR